MQMKHNPNNKTIMHSTFATMSTAELKELLKNDCMMAEDDQLDVDAILYIMEVIDEQEKMEGTLCPELAELDPVAVQADFYNTHFPNRNPFPAQDSPRPDSIQKKKSIRPTYLLIAALVAVMVCSISASAFEFSFLKLFAQWTEDTFQFVSQIVMGSSAEDSDQLSELREAIRMDSSLKLVPHWCPPGYEEVDTQHYALTSKSFATTTLNNGADDLVITITHHKLGLDTHAYIAEKELTEAIPFEAGGITHYIILNTTTIFATWVCDDFVCDITGTISQEDMEDMIESIY